MNVYTPVYIDTLMYYTLHIDNNMVTYKLTSYSSFIQFLQND